MAVFSLAMLLSADLVAAPPGLDGTLSVIAGAQLEPDEAEALEERLHRNPHDSTARMQLLGYHSSKQWTDPASAERHGELVLWMIRNDPRNPVLGMPYGHIEPHLRPQAYAQAKGAWLERIEYDPEDVVLLGHAAALVGGPSEASDHDLAISLLERARAADPHNAEWHFKLGQIYSMQGTMGVAESEEAAAAKALPYFERAYQIGGVPFGAIALISVMRAAFTAGEVDDARAYALEVLDSQDPLLGDGDARHRANVTLGRVVLAEGDHEEAGRYLLAAGRAGGSPSLSTFGPNMRLAQELLERGQRDVVLEYFELCGAFWKKDQLDEWADQVRAGEMPEFGANLVY